MLILSQGWGLIDLLLRASNEGSPRPRVARAQKIIRLHPLPCSASKKGTWPLPPLLAGFFSILLHHNAATGMDILARQPTSFLTDDERHHIGNVFRRTKPF